MYAILKEVFSLVGLLGFLSTVLFVFETRTSTKYLRACGSRSFKMVMFWLEENIPLPYE